MGQGDKLTREEIRQWFQPTDPKRVSQTLTQKDWDECFGGPPRPEPFWDTPWWPLLCLALTYAVTGFVIWMW